jgi:hypothetical protein
MALEVARFNGHGVAKSGRGAHVDIHARYGEQHEAAILVAYEASGTGRGEDALRAALGQVVDAMRRGAEVIHQATLERRLRPPHRPALVRRSTPTQRTRQ